MTVNGVLYRVIPKQVLTIPTTLPSAVTWIAKGVDITNFTQAVLIVRTHTGTALGASGGLQINVYPDAPTSEEATDFLQNPLTSIASVTVGSGNTAGSFTITAITLAAGLPAYLRVGFIWLSSSTGQAVVSADINAKC
jgi:hypothetical protein